MLQPLGNRIIVRETSDAEEKTASGIIIQSERKISRHKEGRVLAVGKGQPTGEYFELDQMKYPLFDKVDVEVGDTIIFAFGEEYTIDNEKVYILNGNDILAVKK